MNNVSHIIILIILFSGCGRNTERGKNDIQKKNTEQIVGNSKDEHGCLTSAGYTWSEVRKDCIRCFEVGIPLLSKTDSSSVAYIVFSNDSSQVELFFPDKSQNKILDRRKLPNGGYAWNIEDDDTKNVRKIDGRWIIEQRGKLLYQQISSQTKDSINNTQK